ncbi:transcriptional repressor [Thalassotalea aquiviva]|uniref:transcriptional repressor n=1 Tax=Thalassotalea aquiviva TaxID=3242415 RepID=UPI00352B7B23
MNVNKLLQQAKDNCKRTGARFTPAREQVFLIMANNHGPMGAYELLDELKKQDTAAKPATVYRALDFLAKQGFVHKIESINAFLLCDHFSECNHPVQLLICDDCGAVEEIQSNNLELVIKTMADASGFKITHQVVEAHGQCQQCQAA